MRMRKTTILWFSTVLFLLMSAFSTGGRERSAPIVPAAGDGIVWMSWEEAMIKMESQKKKIIHHTEQRSQQRLRQSHGLSIVTNDANFGIALAWSLSLP